MPTPLDDLINLVEHLDRLPEPWARNAATRVNRFVSGETRDVAAALDLKTPPGKRARRTVPIGEARDAAIQPQRNSFPH
ncbi:hypothetical protein LZK76_02920 [Rhizobium leguminosarum]|nr:hypothetical protein LZK76_02920 [Rhizobium leguminosarum]